jgi:hypothetical protein
MTIYAVEGGEYSDYRIDSLWTTREAAQARLDTVKDVYGYGDLAVVPRAVNDPDVAGERVAWVCHGSYGWTNDENHARLTYWVCHGSYGWTNDENHARLTYPSKQYRRQVLGPNRKVTADPYGVKVDPPTVQPFPLLRVAVVAETEERAAKVCSERLNEEIVKLEQGFYGDMMRYVTEYVPSTYTSGATIIVTIGGDK